jgi:hypothetical protein
LRDFDLLALVEESALPEPELVAVSALFLDFVLDDFVPDD